jgi:hypothetical protein
MAGTVVVQVPRSSDGTPFSAAQRLTLGRESFTRVDNGSELMNIDGRAAGTPVNVWNGTGAGDTGADWSTSGEGSETAESKHDGTYGWDTGVTTDGTATFFDYGSEQDIAGTYDEVDLWVQPKAFPTSSRLQIRWLDSTDSPVSDQLRVDQYAANMDLDVWQKVSIPVADFNLTGAAQKLRLRYGNTAGQRYWFDDIELVASSGAGPYTFRIEAPDANTIYHVTMAVLLIAAPATGWNLNAFANIAGGLTTGLVFRHRRKSASEMLWRFVSKNNAQLFGQFHPQDDITFADDNLLIGFMAKPGKASVLITDDDVLEFVVKDDLREISEMRAYCHYGVEVVP